MLSEAYKEPTHAELVRLARWCAPHRTKQVWSEFRLPDGHIADVFYKTRQFEFGIIEVKTSWRASQVEQAWKKYRHWCHYLTLAIPSTATTSAALAIEHHVKTRPWQDIGILILHSNCIRLVHTPISREPLPEHIAALRLIT